MDNQLSLTEYNCMWLLIQTLIFHISYASKQAPGHAQVRIYKYKPGLIHWHHFNNAIGRIMKYQPYPLLSYFSVAVCLRCFLHHILSPIAYIFRENQDFVFIIIVQFMMSANSWTRFGLQIVFICLCITPSHYHYCANLSEDISL